MIVTTSRRHADDLREKAIYYSGKLGCPFIIRNDLSVQRLIDDYEKDVFIVGREKITLHSKQGGVPFFYHPNSAMLRGKQFLKTKRDPLVDVARLKKGMTFLDCTLGLAADSLIAKLAVGRDGHVTGVEANQVIATIVANGLRTWDEGSLEILCAMKEIEVVQAGHYEYLQTLADQSVDIVYFDPMFDPIFEHTLTKSLGINGLKQFAYIDDLTEETMQQAYRVCKSRIILKDHRQSKRFEKHRFNVIERKSTVFHYGYIDVFNRV